MTSTATPEVQSGSQPRGLWLKLPTELRLQIYEFMFPRESVRIFAVRDRLEKEANANFSAGHCVAILATCRTIHDEAKPVLYANTSFDISCSMGNELPSKQPVKIQQARNIDLHIILARGLPSGVSWLNQLPAHLSSSFPILEKIHIKLCANRGRGPPVREQANRVFSLLARSKEERIAHGTRKARITVAMDPSLGGMGFVKAHFDRMCEEVGIRDITQAKYTETQAALSSEHDGIQRELAVLSARLDVELPELTEIKKDVCWSVRPASKARADQIAGEMQSITDNIFKLHENTDRVQRTFESLQRQQQLLMSGP